MTKASLTVAVSTILLCAGMALATATPQQKCDKARFTAWKTYVVCVENVVAKDVGGAIFDEQAAFAKCRHTYFRNWSKFQLEGSLATSTCIGIRFVDNLDGTVTDNLSGLVWDKKISDLDTTYTWSAGSPYLENGTVFTGRLANVNGGGGLAGKNDWWVPTLAELETLLRDFTCTGAGLGPGCSCLSSPCVDTVVGATQPSVYWSATSDVSTPTAAWSVDFGFAYVGKSDKTVSGFIYGRTVRAGL